MLHHAVGLGVPYFWRILPSAHPQSHEDQDCLTRALNMKNYGPLRYQKLFKL